jgi:hypothetical protein
MEIAASFFAVSSLADLFRSLMTPFSHAVQQANNVKLCIPSTGPLVSLTRSIGAPDKLRCPAGAIRLKDDLAIQNL